MALGLSTEAFRREPLRPLRGSGDAEFLLPTWAGPRRSTKPDALFAGGRQRARPDPVAAPPILLAHPSPSLFGGSRFAAPPQDGTFGLHFTIGTSAAAALATHSAHRASMRWMLAYPELISKMPLGQRAALLKALLVHAASWRGSEDFIRSVIDEDAQTTMSIGVERSAVIWVTAL